LEGVVKQPILPQRMEVNVNPPLQILTSRDLMT